MSFEDVVYDDSKDVFVEFYTYWHVTSRTILFPSPDVLQVRSMKTFGSHLGEFRREIR
jgi:hypothetical protein